MVHKICRLSDEVINKIAAGEVVENPASIVKELIENSLDAGSTRIDVSIEGDGIRSIRIEDDGCGMAPDDALLSLERHATSKIRTEIDLGELSTMGFRGEALAAIASVSLLEMRTSDGSSATKIEAEGGRAFRIEPCARNPGTTVLVRDLFFNVPARKKFLKSPSSNAAGVARIVETIAIAHPEVSFSLSFDGKNVMQAFPEERRKRIETLFGPLPFEASSSGLWGLLGSPDEAKTHRRGQYLFINRRPVVSPLISRAVKAGYGTRIAENSHPSFVFFLEVPPDRVDVNVHPQKREVRFSDEGKMFRLFEQTSASAFVSKAEPFERTLSFSPPTFFHAQDAFSKLPPTAAASPLTFDFSAERPLAIVEGYLFLQAEKLLLVDLQGAHARVLYESLKEKKGAAQSLMWPVEASVEDEGIVDELLSMGIECRLIGKRMLAVDALPSLMEPDDCIDFLNAWREGKKLDAAASRYARGAKKKFSVDEAIGLWRELRKCRETLFCPSGRRIWGPIGAHILKKILEEL